MLPVKTSARQRLHLLVCRIIKIGTLEKLQRSFSKAAMIQGWSIIQISFLLRKTPRCNIPTVCLGPPWSTNCMHEQKMGLDKANRHCQLSWPDFYMHHQTNKQSNCTYAFSDLSGLRHLFPSNPEEACCSGRKLCGCGSWLSQFWHASPLSVWFTSPLWSLCLNASVPQSVDSGICGSCSQNGTSQNSKCWSSSVVKHQARLFPVGLRQQFPSSPSDTRFRGLCLWAWGVWLLQAWQVLPEAVTLTEPL